MDHRYPPTPPVIDRTPASELQDPFPSVTTPPPGVAEASHIAMSPFELNGMSRPGDVGTDQDVPISDGAPAPSTPRPVTSVHPFEDALPKRTDTPNSIYLERGRRSASPSPARPPTVGSSVSQLSQAFRAQDAFIPLLRGVPQIPVSVSDKPTAQPRKPPRRRNTLSAIGERDQGRDTADSLNPFHRVLDKHERVLSEFANAIERLVKKLPASSLSGGSHVYLPSQPQPYGDLARAAGLNFRRESKEMVVWAQIGRAHV